METNNRGMIETLLEASLSENYSNTKEFMYEMAKRYRRVDQGYFTLVVSTVSESEKRYITLFPATSPKADRFQNPFSVTLASTFAVSSSLDIPPQLTKMSLHYRTVKYLCSKMAVRKDGVKQTAA